MCLAIPGKIEQIQSNNALVNFNGVKRRVDISLIDSCEINDYVLVHVGFAIQKVDEKTAKETYRLLADIDGEKLDSELKTK